MRWAALTGLVVTALAWPAGHAAAQACRRDCKPGEKRDPRGCCIAARRARPARKPPPAVTQKQDQPEVEPPPRPPERGKPRTPAELRAACEAGKTDACGRFAEVYFGDDLDPGTLAELYGRGCAADHALACVRLGFLFEKGKGVKQNFRQAREHYQKACDKGSPAGCNSLGWVYYGALGVVKDLDRAMRLFRKACDAGTMVACSNLGWVYERGKRDYQEAVKWYLTACEGRNGVGCANVAVLLVNAGAYDKARPFFKRACELGNTPACEYAD